MGHGKRDRLLHGWVGGGRVLDLEGRHLLSRAVDHLLGASDEEDVAVGKVEARSVAGAQVARTVAGRVSHERVPRLLVSHPHIG